MYWPLLTHTEINKHDPKFTPKNYNSVHYYVIFSIYIRQLLQITIDYSNFPIKNKNSGFLPVFHMFTNVGLRLK